MKRKNTTRSALITSIIALLLCVSMLVGTTFAWFTDSVSSGMNTIAAGNLDVELLANGVQVESDTELFELADPNLWEPGVVAYENLQVVNKGSLALKYQMTLNFGSENDLNGHKLSEVLKVAVIDEIKAGTSRADVLAAAKAAVEENKGKGELSNFYMVGDLEAGESATTQAVVIFWDPNDNATDNLYNANNGKTTSDGQPLHIEFGVNLQATQKMSESDSFGSDYDKYASILPKATVNDVSAQYPSVNATIGIGGAASEMPLDFALQFLPNETLEQAMSNGYKYYNADYVIKADRDVPANSIALAGYYHEWCQHNNNNWVSLTSPVAITAGTEVRLVEPLGYVSYKDICQYGNDGIGFLCGAVDLTGENAGTTITVELRLYETTSDPNNSSNDGNEVGPDAYEVVGTYSYTFAMGEQENVKYVRTAAELQDALDNAQDGAVIAFGADITGDVVATQKPDVDVTINGCGKKFTGVMTVFGDGNENFAETLAIKDINFVAAEGAESCIVSPGYDANTKHSYAHNVTVEGCTFTDPDGAVNCAAIRSTEAGDKNWIVRDCTVDTTMHSLLQASNINGKLTVTGCEVNSKNGINLNSTTNLEMANCNFNVKGYAVRFGVNSGGNPTEAKTFVIKDSTLKSACEESGDAVIIFRATAANASLTLTNTTIVGTPEISGNTDATTITHN